MFNMNNTAADAHCRYQKRARRTNSCPHLYRMPMPTLQGSSMYHFVSCPLCNTLSDVIALHSKNRVVSKAEIIAHVFVPILISMEAVTVKCQVFPIIANGTTIASLVNISI